MSMPQPKLPRWKIAASLAQLRFSRGQIAELMSCSTANVEGLCIAARNHGEHIPRRVPPKGAPEVIARVAIDEIDRKLEALAVAVDKLCERDPCTAAALLDVRADLQRVQQFALPAHLRAAMATGAAA